MNAPNDEGPAGTGAPGSENAAHDPSGSGNKLPTSVVDLVSRTLMLGVGAAALTIDKAQGVVDELVKRGQLTSDEARDTVASLAARSKTEARSTVRSLESTLKSTYRETGRPTIQLPKATPKPLVEKNTLNIIAPVMIIMTMQVILADSTYPESKPAWAANSLQSQDSRNTCACFSAESRIVLSRCHSPAEPE